jgi:hypothetical protein
MAQRRGVNSIPLIVAFVDLLVDLLCEKKYIVCRVDKAAEQKVGGREE